MTILVGGIGRYEKGRYAGWSSGKNTKEYNLWDSMIKRCIPCGSEQIRHPSYIGCSVHLDFIKFQDFAEWCQHQIGFGNDGWALDKDILVPGNKVYGPDTCAFVPRQLNQLLTHKRSTQGEYPTGVDHHKRTGKYRASIGIDGVQTHIGYFETPEQAECAYKQAKLSDIRRHAEIWKSKLDLRVYERLMNYE